MGQSASLYALNAQSFTALPTTGPIAFNDLQAAVYHVRFDKSFMALEFLLQRLRPDSQELLSNIFGAPHSVQAPPFSGIDFEWLNEEAQEAFFEYLDHAIQYVTPTEAAAISAVLRAITPAELGAAYDPSLLNQHRIYPEIWHADEAPDRAFNRRHLVSDFTRLQAFFAQATAAQLYVLNAIG